MTKNNTKYSEKSKNNKYNTGLRLITEFYKEPTQKLIIYLREKHNVSLDEIAEVIGISRAAIQSNWLKEIKDA